MATQIYDAALRLGVGEAIRWWRMTAIALASVLVWTVILGLMLAPRWPELTPLAASATTLAASATNQRPIALPPTSIDHAKDPQPAAEPAMAPVRASDPQSDARPATFAVVAISQQPTALPSSAARQPVAPADTGEPAVAGRELSIDADKLASVRPKTYSSIDAQTLAAARVRGEVLAGKRAPVTDSAPVAESAPLVAARENDATAIPPVGAEQRAPRVTGSSDRAQSTAPRMNNPQFAGPPLKPLPETSPRVESATLNSRAAPARRPSARVEVPESPSPARASPRTPTSRLELAQTSPFGREAKRVEPISRSEVSQWPSPPRADPPRFVRVAPATGADVSQWPSPPRADLPQVVQSAAATAASRPDRDTAVAQAASRAAPVSPQQEALAARLDDSWERRERWLRDRLQTR